MSSRALARLLLGYAFVLAFVCASVRGTVALHDVDGETIASVWRGGELVARATGHLDYRSVLPGARLVREKVIAEGPLARMVTDCEPLFALSIVSGRDGVKATLGDKTAYVTPDDLLARQAYDKGITIPSLTLSLGADVPLIEALLAERLGTTVPELRARAAFRRIRTRRTAGLVAQPFADTTPGAITPDLLRGAALEAARYLARGVNAQGRFRYMVDAPTNQSLPGYDWPRHAGATYFLAQAADLSHEALLVDAALRAASYLRDSAMQTCGDARCIGSDDVVDVGSSALGLIAMNEIARTGLDPTYRASVDALARFLRAQQRPDGEFMHQYDRGAQRPIDVQFLYYSGEATLALTRAHALTARPEDLDAARRGLAHLIGPAWSFFGDRYYFGEEHWTCQAMSELWSRQNDAAADARALSFCERWQAYGRSMMYAPGQTPFDADGAYGVGPVVTPRLTPVASRCEAGVATLDAMVRANAPRAERDALASQLRRSLALLLRQQLRPGAVHLFADPAAVYGAMPGSPVDWQLRIDYAQHAGSAMIRAASLAPAL